MLTALEIIQAQPSVVLLCPAVFNKDGKRQYLCKRNPTVWHLFLRRFGPDWLKKLFSQYLNRYEYRDYSYNEQIYDVPFCTGCFMFFRTSVLKKLNGFDERFFLYLEDADLTRSMARQGRCVHLPVAGVVHGWGRGNYRNLRLMVVNLMSAWRYFAKWGWSLW